MPSKKILFKIYAGFLCLLSFKTFAVKSILISDIDDTIKQTGVHQLSTIGGNISSTTNEFAGMSILYNNWYINNKITGNIYYLTAAPKFIDIFGIQFLEASNFPPGFEQVRSHVVSGRDPFSETSEAFKTEKLIELFKKEKPDILILIGDNGEQDILAYANLKEYIKSTNSETQIFIFIHHVYEDSNNSLPIPKDQTPFLTSADLALHFYNQKWINKTDLATSLNEVAYDCNSNLSESVVPYFMECKTFNNWPKFKSKTSKDIQLSKNYAQIQNILHSLCE